MAHEIQLSPSAVRDLRRVDRAELTRVLQKVESLADEPRPRGCEKPSGYDNLLRVRVGGHRIVYGIQAQESLVVILKVGDRTEINRRLKDCDHGFLRSLVEV